MRREEPAEWEDCDRNAKGAGHDMAGAQEETAGQRISCGDRGTGEGNEARRSPRRVASRHGSRVGARAIGPAFAKVHHPLTFAEVQHPLTIDARSDGLAFTVDMAQWEARKWCVNHFRDLLITKQYIFM